MNSRKPSPPRPDRADPTGRADGTAPEPVLLVTDRPRTSEAGPASALRVPLPAELAARLRDAGMPHAPLMLAAFGIVLRQYTDRCALPLDVDLGRRGAGALTLTIDDDEPAAALLERTARAAVDGPATGTALRFTARDGTADPDPDPAKALTGPACELALTADGDGLHLAFRPALFDQATVHRLGRHLLRALRFVADSPGAPVHTAELSDASERARVLEEFNATARPFPDSATIHGLFAEQAARTPEATALTSRDTRLTYRQLADRAARLASVLRAAGVRAGQPVGLRTERTPEFVVGALGVLMSGGGYVPVEPGLPPARAALLLRDSGARVLVTGPPGGPGSPRVPDLSELPYEGAVVRTDATGPTDGAGMGAGTAAPGAGADGLAYVCYTSGTTGTPKGVEVTHRNVVRLVRGADYVAFGPGTRILPTGSIAFDATTFEMWGALLNGGSLHLVDSDTVLSARRLGAELAARGVTTMWLTAPLFNRLTEQDATAFRPLRELVVGGDALSAPHIAKVMDACPELALVNGYGPTENTTFSTTHRIRRADLDRIPIGRPIANSTAYVLDPRGRPCPVGVPGELWLGGAGVARGYLGQPELTAERFVPDPFAPGGRLYRSGDLARWRADGAIEFLGRRDHQVKLRGFRVEPAEVEQAMLGHPDVTEACVTVRAQPGRAEKFLCGHYAARRAAGPDELRRHLALTLPEHMIPAYLVPVDALPLNPNGKVDRARLPEPPATRRPAGPDGAADDGGGPRDGHREPADETERVLLELTERALGVTGFGVRHDLRALGADSLTATLVAAGAETRLRRRCPVSAVLRSGTLENLARLLREPGSALDASDGLGGAGGVSIPAAPRTATAPPTPQQRQLYFEQLKDESAVHYNVPVTLDLPAGTDPERLAAALRKLTAAHEALRTCFVLDDDGAIRQRVEREVPVPLRVLDDPAPPLAEFVRPFDLAVAPLWRAELSRTGSGAVLRLDLHHLVVDGFSLVTLFDDLATCYAGGDPEPPAVAHRDYAAWLAGPEGQALRAAQAPYWREVFPGPVAPAELPADFPRPLIRSVESGTVAFGLDSPRTAALRGLAGAHGVTLFAVLASAHHVLLSALTGRADVTVGTPVSGRTVSGLHRTVGMFANTVCLRRSVDAEVPFGRFLREMGQAAEDASAHQDVPFEDVVAHAAPVRDYSRTPLFDALIALHSGRYLSVDFAGHRVPIRLEPPGQTPFDLNMQIYERDGTLNFSWQYASALFARATVESWRGAYTALLDTVAAAPHTRLGDLLAVCRPGRPAPEAQGGRTAEPEAAFDFDL